MVRDMPRPLKHVPADSLGGRIRAARENKRLSLAAVAAGEYSTSLLSQIERNRVEPSEKSLEFLAARLGMSLEDLRALAQQSRESEASAQQYTVYEELRLKAEQLFKNKQLEEALTLLGEIPV